MTRPPGERPAPPAASGAAVAVGVPSAGAGRPRVPIDPRIRERRIAVRRDEGRRRLRLIVAAAAVVGVVVIAWGVTRSPLLAVARIDVSGAGRTGDAAVVAASGLRAGEAMTGVREDEVAARVRRLPWVAGAVVTRHWPRTVSVTVTERTAAAALRAAGGGWMLVDAGGRLLARVAQPLDDLPAIEGAPPAGDLGGSIDGAARGALAVALAIPRARVAEVRVVALLPDGSIELRLGAPPGGPGGIVRFGPPDQIDDKLVAVFTVLDRVDVRRLAVLDVRVPTAPVVTRHS